MQPDQHELSRTYPILLDAEIASLYAQIETLSDVAQIALRKEIEPRHLSREQLLNLCSSQLREEGNFNRREKLSRMSRFKRIGISPFSIAAMMATVLVIGSVFS